jgi:hypothetical protein
MKRWSHEWCHGLVNEAAESRQVRWSRKRRQADRLDVNAEVDKASQACARPKGAMTMQRSRSLDQRVDRSIAAVSSKAGAAGAKLEQSWGRPT